MSFATYAGPEIGVASTKAFTCQLAVLACLAIAAGRLPGELSMIAQEDERCHRRFKRSPPPYEQILRQERHIAEVARKLASARDVLYLGRGINYPIALEGL